MLPTDDELKTLMRGLNHYIDNHKNFPLPVRSILRDLGLDHLKESDVDDFLRAIGLNPVKVADLFNLTIPSDYKRISDEEMNEILTEYGGYYR